MNNNIYSVSNIVNNLKNVILNNFNLNINIQGEISNFKIYKERNLYLTLKDKDSSINVVFYNYTDECNLILYDGWPALLRTKVVLSLEQHAVFLPTSGRNLGLV